MGVAIGSRLGRYEVTGALGAGGMGEVYRAHDSRLNRSVALKVLPPSFATDPDRLARFEREARALAALSHPHIAHIYGFEEATGDGAGPPVCVLVMELVPGESLAHRLRNGALPVTEALEFARQIADGLAAAHARGFVHRDLKPANIQITPDGTVKILDFGLAKAVDVSDPPSHESAQNPTITTPAQMTQQGIVLGTAAYMSPEQAKGLPVDRRTDIWSFGCVMFEMLTGHRLFDGSDVSDVLASVLRAEVDWTLMPTGVPPLVRAFLMRCLHRDVRQRVQDIGDMRLALEGAFDTAVSSMAPAPQPVWKRMAPLAAAVLLAAASAAILAWSGPGSGPAPVVSRMRLALPPGNDFYFNGRHLVAVSPDGRHVAYSAGLGLWLHSLDALDARVVAGAEDEGRSPFFSPDGQWLGFYAAGELRRAPVTGGNPVKIVNAVNPWGASWAQDGNVYYGQGPDGIWRVPSAGGSATRVISVKEGELAHGPQLLPDGEWVLFTLLPSGVGSWNRATIVVESLRTQQRIVLIEGGRDARYLATGHLLYAVNGVLFAVPFDARAPKVMGGSVPVVQNVFDAGTVTGAAHFAVSPEGALVYVPRIGNALRLTWVDRRGNEEPIPGELRPYRHPHVSPDGTRLVVEVEDPANTDVWVGDVRRGTFTRLTSNEDVDSDPIWTPDGTRVVFASVRGKTGLFGQAADGSGSASHIADGTGGVRPLTWTAAGELVYEELAGPDIQVLPLDGRSTARAVRLFEMPEYFNEKLPAISPDGRWIAYQSTESGSMEIYIRPFPDVRAGRWQVSAGGGFAPLWSRDSSEVFYRNDRSLMAAKVTASKTTSSLTVARPEALFRLGDYVLAGTRGIRYDVAPDGRFLLLKDEDGRETRDRIVVVQHWFEELKRTVAGR